MTLVNLKGITDLNITGSASVGATVNGVTSINFTGGGGGFTILASYPGSSLSGWTVNGTVNVRNTASSPSITPSAFQPNAATSNNAYIDPGIALTGKTILFDFLAVSGGSDLVNFFFGMDNTGAGPGLQIDTRGGANPGAAIITEVGWVPNAYTTPPAGAFDAVNLSSGFGARWHQGKLVLDGGGANVILYIDDVEYVSSAITLKGTFIGFGGGGGANGTYYRNIIIGQ